MRRDRAVTSDDCVANVALRVSKLFGPPLSYIVCCIDSSYSDTTIRYSTSAIFVKDVCFDSDSHGNVHQVSLFPRQAGEHKSLLYVVSFPSESINTRQ